VRASSLLSASVLFTLAASTGWAAPATEDGAKAIAQGYAAYLTQGVIDKGLVSVTPQGDDYLVSWDLQKIIDLAKPPPGTLTVDKFSYVLTLAGDDAWTVKSEHFPPVKFDVTTEKGKMAGTFDLSGFHLDTAYDGKLSEFLTSTALAALLSAKINVVESEGPGDIDVSEAGLAISTRGKAAQDGVDVSIVQTIKNLNETVTSSDPNGGGPLKMTFTGGAGTSEASFAALKAREIGDLWKFVVAHADEGHPPPEVKTRVGATLPLWNDFRVSAELRDLAADIVTPMVPVHAEMKGLAESFAMSGFAAHSYAEVGVKITDLTTKIAMLPPWSASVQPASLDIDMKVTVDGLDQVAQLALNDPGFGGMGDLSEATRNKIRDVVLNGHPKLTIAPGRFATPALEISYEGEVVKDGEKPAGHFVLSANGLDKTQALIQEIAKSIPDAQQALLALAFIKGLATTGPDGRLVWKIEFTGDGVVTINGNPMPTGE